MAKLYQMTKSRSSYILSNAEAEALATRFGACDSISNAEVEALATLLGACDSTPKSRSTATKDVYERAISQFGAWATAEDQDVSVDAVANYVFMRVQSDVVFCGSDGNEVVLRRFSPSALNTALAAFRAENLWHPLPHTAKGLAKGLMHYAKEGRGEPQRARVISADEIIDIMNYCSSIGDVAGKRNAAMFGLSFMAMLRVNEILSLKKKDVILGEESIRIMLRERKNTTPIGVFNIVAAPLPECFNACRKALEDWHEYSFVLPGESEFCRLTGNYAGGAIKSANTIDNALVAAFSAMQFDTSQLSCNSLRRGGAQARVAAGQPFLEVQELGGGGNYQFINLF